MKNWRTRMVVITILLMVKQCHAGVIRPLAIEMQELEQQRERLEQNEERQQRWQQLKQQGQVAQHEELTNHPTADALMEAVLSMPNELPSERTSSATGQK